MQKLHAFYHAQLNIMMQRKTVECVIYDIASEQCASSPSQTRMAITS